MVTKRTQHFRGWIFLNHQVESRGQHVLVGLIECASLIPSRGQASDTLGFFPQPVQNLSQLLLFSCLQDGQNNNGYVPYVDYARDYNPPPPTEGSRESLSAVTSVASVTGVPSIHPCYSAAYGNSCLRNSNTSLLPAPPSYSTATRNGAVPQVARLPNSPTSQYIVPTSQPTTMRRGTLATHV